MNRRSTPFLLLIPGLAAAVAAGVLFVQCQGKTTTTQTGREWVNAGKSRKFDLVGDGSVLHVDKSWLEPLQQNYASYISLISSVYKERRYFNRTSVPFLVYLMPDQATLEAHCRQPLIGRGTFVAAEGAIYLHAAGQQLVDGGIRRALVDGLARAVCKDIYYGKGPAWLIEGSARLHADGGFGLPKGKRASNMKDFVWFQGVPDAEFFAPLLDPDKRKQLPSFATVRDASPAEFAKLGADGARVATAACYVLENIEQLATVIWQINPVNKKTVLEAFKEYVPRHVKQFADPAATLFKLRPDFEVYLQCANGTPDAATLAKAKQNAAANADIGAYWLQCARIIEKLGLSGRESEAVEVLEKCRQCPVFPGMHDALAMLADLHYGAKNWDALLPVVNQQLVVSVLPTPRMHMMFAEAVRSKDAAAAKQNVKLGLALPGKGFEKAVARLQELKKELGL